MIGNLGLSPEQLARQAEFRAFVDQHVVPHADRYHHEQRTPPAAIAQLVQNGYLGLCLPQAHGGAGADSVTWGLLMEELGRGCSSLRSLLTVHSMVARAILRWGSRAQKERWLPALAQGRVLGAFALSEPSVGSDANSVTTSATADGDHFILRGEKKWITYGQLADLFLVFATCGGQPAAFLVERDRPGVSTVPIGELLGLRASMTARVLLTDCRIPKDNLLGRLGFGISHVAATALDHGRSCVAWGCVGIGQACLDDCIVYTQERVQFGVPLKEHQLIRRLISDMITEVAAARLLCLQAARLREAQDPEALSATAIAKYFAAKTAVAAADSTVQIHGANGCGRDYSAQRYLGDAKIMEIIEGSSQIQQLTIAEYGYQEYGALKRRRSASSPLAAQPAEPAQREPQP